MFCSTFVVCRASPTNGTALRKSYVHKVTDVWKITNAQRSPRVFETNIWCSPRAGTETPARGLPDPVTNGDITMRSKLAISALVVASLFGSTLIASAQSQTAPGASNDGTVSPGATSGKKAKHEKGMTTGSSTRSGTSKGGVANPSDPDSAGSGAGNMAAPKSGSKY
jgi:hypothetical protein